MHLSLCSYNSPLIIICYNRALLLSSLPLYIYIFSFSFSLSLSFTNILIVRPIKRASNLITTRNSQANYRSLPREKIHRDIQITKKSATRQIELHRFIYLLEDCSTKKSRVKKNCTAQILRHQNLTASISSFVYILNVMRITFFFMSWNLSCKNLKQLSNFPNISHIQKIIL